MANKTNKVGVFKQATFNAATDKVLKAVNIRDELAKSLANLGMSWPTDMSQGNEPGQR